MGMIESSATRIARNIRQHHPQAASEAVLKYALIIVLNTMAIIAISLIISSFTGRWIETVFAIIAFGILKFFTGGIHLQSSTACTVASTAMLMTIVHVPFRYEYGGIFLIVLAIILFYLYAPGGQVRKGTLPERYIPLLKWGAILVCLSNLYWQSALLSLVIAVQACSLTPVAFKLVNILERRLGK